MSGPHPVVLRRRQYARLAGIFFVAASAVSLATLPVPPRDQNVGLTVTASVVGIAVGVACWFLPWHRWPQAASLALAPIGLGLIALGNVAGGSDYHTYGVFFVLVFVWIGIAQPPWTSLYMTPFALLAYILPIYHLPGSVASGVGSAAITIPVCILVGEGLARGMRRVSRTEEDLLREQASAERLRQLDELKTTFLRGVSHDLRGPLAAIQGMAHLIAQEDDDAPAVDRKELAERIVMRTDRLENLLDDLLDIDRLEHGIVEPDRRPVEVSTLTRRVTEMCEPLSGRDVRLYAPSVWMSVDGPKVERILDNLLVNAARHTPRDATVWVNALPGGEGLLLSVEDSGPGIPAGLRSRIFDLFSAGATVDGATGLGIGLFLVSRFAEIHGGRAWVEDRPGGGASFKVLVPGDILPPPASRA